MNPVGTLDFSRLGPSVFHPSGPQGRLVVAGRIGDPARPPALIAGPCSAESRDQVRLCAEAARLAGADFLRGGAWKPRTFPGAFQGCGSEALGWLVSASEAYDLPLVVEARDLSHLKEVAEAVGRRGVVQIGSRNAQNYELLTRAGEVASNVLLKRGMAQTLEEWLASAEYVMAGGAAVALCERGVRPSDPWLRNTFDVGGLALLRRVSRLPLVADPSHGTGLRAIVRQVAVAAVAAGADAIMVEAHPNPDHSVTDAAQALPLTALAPLRKALKSCWRAAREDPPSGSR